MTRTALPTLLVLLVGLAGVRLAGGEPRHGSAAEAGSPPGSGPRPLTLAGCLSLAREHNPTVAQTRERIGELIADYEVTRSSFLPRIALTAYYQRLNRDRLLPGGFIPVGQQLFDQEGLATISAKQVVFSGGKTYYGARGGTLAVAAQRAALASTADDVAYTVTEAFFRLVEAKADLEVAVDARKQKEAFAVEANVLFRAGKATSLDALRARAQAADAAQAEMEAQNAITLARVILATAIGLGPEATVDVAGELPEALTPAPGLETLWQAALRANPEIKKLDLSLAQSQALIAATRGGYYPEVSLQGSAGVRHHDIAGTRGEWMIGAFLDFPLFEGGLTRAQVAKATSQRLQLLAQKRARLDSLRADLATAWRDQENARRGVATARQTVAMNVEAYAAAEALYRAGKALALDVLQAQADLTAARFSLIRYQVSYVLAQARVRRITHEDAASPRPAERS
jgi:outer membrane protein